MERAQVRQGAGMHRTSVAELTLETRGQAGWEGPTQGTPEGRNQTKEFCPGPVEGMNADSDPRNRTSGHPVLCGVDF